MSVSVTPETGRYNAVSSFMAWLTANVTSPMVATARGDIRIKFIDRRPLEQASFVTVDGFRQTLVSVNDIGIPQPPAKDLFDVLTYADDGTPFRGRHAETMLEIIVWDHAEMESEVQPGVNDADARISLVRDFLIHCLSLAGSKNGAVDVKPPILISNYAADTVTPPATANYVSRDRTGAWLSEHWLNDDQHPEIRGWRMTTKIRWPEFWAA